MAPMITRHFATLFSRQVLRTAKRHPVLLLLNILSIAMGVAVFLAIQIANRSAAQSFRAGIEMVAGRANLEVRGSIDERVLPEISALPGVRAAAPVVEALLTLPGHPGEYLRVVGLDPFSARELRTFDLLGADQGSLDFERWLRERDAIAVSTEFSERLLPALGSPLRVQANGQLTELAPVFVIQPDDAAAAADPRLVAMDIGWAQELTGTAGKLSAIQLLVDEDRIAEVANAVRSLVPADVTVAPPARRGDQVESMLGAFQLNLTALSLVSVLVGAFLIYNTISASVIRRQSEIGILRAVGASRAEIRLLFLGEGAFAGLVGTVGGMALALPLASLLSGPVAQTVSSLYIALSIERLYLAPGQFVQALIVGVGTALAASWLPAAEAANAEPAKVLRPGSGMDRFASIPLRWLGFGAAGLVLAAVCGWGALEWRIAPLGFASAFFVLSGFSLLVPVTVRMASGVFAVVPGKIRMAARNLSRSVHRNSVTIAALAAAIAMTVSISVMVHSFRSSVDRWIGATLVADLFIGSAANEVASAGALLPSRTVEWLANHPQVERVSTFVEVPLIFYGERTAMAIVSGSTQSETQFVGGDAASQFADFLKPDHVLVSEPFANRFNVERGSQIALPTSAGEKEFTIAGVYQDYARNGGVVLIDRENAARHWPDAGVQSVALNLKPGSDPDALANEFRSAFGQDGLYSIYSNAALRGRIFEIFDQTFAVTLVLRSISVLVAAVGVLLALIILTAERSREIGTLRAVGASRGQVVVLFLYEAGMIGLVSSVVGVLSGACLAMVLTWVVNKAFFGWTIDLAFPVGVLASTPLWIVPVAILAAILPALRAAQVAPAAALRTE
jgi:putative ABC transport system permease protein